MSINYNSKYLKYKLKYIALRNTTMFGGANQSKEKLILFTSVNCGWCNQFAPTWKQLLNDEELKSKYELITYESTNEKDKKYFEKYQVQGYPTIIHENDEKREEYNGDRSVDAIKKTYLKN